MSEAWERKYSTRENFKIDPSLPPFTKMITNRPLDMTLTRDQRFVAPPKYVWVARSNHPNDKPLPLSSDADERETMTASHERFCRIAASSPCGIPSGQSFCTFDVLERMFQELTLAPSYLAYFCKHREKIVRRLHPVFAEINNGGPYGRWIHDLCEHPARALGLFVQAFGDMNGFPCQCCDENYRRSTTKVVHPTSKEAKAIYVMWPFYGCVSFEPFLKGRCGNCCWNENGTCDWQFVEMNPRFDYDPHPLKAGKAIFHMDNPGAVVKLTGWEREQITVGLASAIAEQKARYEGKRAEDRAGR